MRTDNRRKNLAMVSRTINAHQKKKNPNASSQYFGASYVTRDKKWRVQISKDGVRVHHLGYFDTEEEAAKAYDTKCLELYGEHANLNFTTEKK